MSDQQSFAYILNRRPYRENSFLVDLFTEAHGKITCIARPAKKRGKVMRGSLEHFRYLHVTWSGRGELYSLKQADERGRHYLSAEQIMQALYLNELILRLAYPSHPLPELFLYYKNSLHALAKPEAIHTVMNFELYLLHSLGYGMNFLQTSDTNEAIQPEKYYRFIPEVGLVLDGNGIAGVRISGTLIIALRESLLGFSASLLLELRSVLDAIIHVLLAGKPLNSRKLLKFEFLSQS